MRVIITLFWVLSIAAGEAVAQTPDHNLKDYGAALDGHSLQGQDDNALDAAIASARAGVGSSRIWWRGPLVLRREHSTVAGLTIDGDNIYGSTVYKMYSGGALFRIEKPTKLLYQATTLRNFSAPQSAGTPNSYTILVRATSDWAPDGMILENLYLGSGSGPGPWRTIDINGLGRTAPWGIRQPVIRNVTCFGSSAYPTCYIAGTASLYAMGLMVYPAGGTYGGFLEQYNDLPRIW